MYVLQRRDGKYVAHSGAKNSYTSKLENAHVFRTKEEAEVSRCVDNERTIHVSELFVHKYRLDRLD